MTGAPAAAAPAVPTTESPVVKGSGQTATPTTGAAADATRVAADGQPAAALDPASRSPLAFTGATAVSMLVASLLLLLVGVAALAPRGAATTPGLSRLSVGPTRPAAAASEARVGCIVWSTTASSSELRASRSTWSRSRAENPR